MSSHGTSRPGDPSTVCECRCDGNPAGGSCSYPDCQLEPPTTEELLGECGCDYEMADWNGQTVKRWFHEPGCQRG